MTLKNKVNVNIAGYDYTLVGVESYEYIQKVARYIDNKYFEVSNTSTKLSTSMKAILTSINVADDYFKAINTEESIYKELQESKKEIENLKMKLSELTKNINEINLENEKLSKEIEIVRNNSKSIKKR
jgi:cell division protein ZapA